METKYRIWTKKGIMSDWLPHESILLFRGPSVVFYESLFAKPFVDRDLARIKEDEKGLPLPSGVIGYDQEKEVFFLYADGTITPIQEYLVRQLLQKKRHEHIRLYVESGRGSIADYLAEQA